MNSANKIDLLTEIARIIGEQEDICIIMHPSPDGDTLGAALGLYHALKPIKPGAWIYCIDKPPRVYHFLPDVEVIQHTYHPARLVIAVDCADEKRMGLTPDQRSAVDTMIVIDHHTSNPGFGTVNWIEGGASSTSELIYQLLCFMHIAVTPTIADSLYTGIITDTGRYSFEYTHPQALRVGADLIEKGADFARLCYLIFQKRTLAKTRLIAMALSTLEVIMDGKACLMHVTMDMLSRCGATAEDTEAIINYGIEVEGMQVAVLIHQTDEKQYKVSFRATGGANVAVVATALGGGGHVQASGCSLSGDYASVRARALQAVTEHAQIQ